MRDEHIKVDDCYRTALVEAGLENETPLMISSSLLLHSSTWRDLLERSGVQEVQILNGLGSQLQLLIPTGLLESS